MVHRHNPDGRDRVLCPGRTKWFGVDELRVIPEEILYQSPARSGKGLHGGCMLHRLPWCIGQPDPAEFEHDTPCRPQDTAKLVEERQKPVQEWFAGSIVTGHLPAAVEWWREDHSIYTCVR